MPSSESIQSTGVLIQMMMVILCNHSDLEPSQCGTTSRMVSFRQNQTRSNSRKHAPVGRKNPVGLKTNSPRLASSVTRNLSRTSGKHMRSRPSWLMMVDGGKLSTNEKANLKGCGKAWFDEPATTSILSLKNVSVKEGFHVLCNSAGDQGFTVQKPNGKAIHFKMHPDGLHCHGFTNPKASFLQTVKENEQGCSQRQLEEAALAKDLHAKVGHPSQPDFKAMVAGRMILNCPITVAKVIRTEQRR
jgi:hypothetical protein